MKWRRERLEITRVSDSASGMVTRAISARSGETTIIIDTTPISVSMEVSNWLKDGFDRFPGRSDGRCRPDHLCDPLGRQESPGSS